MDDSPGRYLESVTPSLDGENLVTNGTRWFADRVEGMFEDAELPAELRIHEGGAARRWNVEALVDKTRAILLDVLVVGPDLNDETLANRINTLNGKAAAEWRAVTTAGGIGEIRPWIGFVALLQRPTSAISNSLEELCRFRVVDAACVLHVDGDVVRGASASLSLEAFGASLRGRIGYVSAAQPG